MVHPAYDTSLCPIISSALEVKDKKLFPMEVPGERLTDHPEWSEGADSGSPCRRGWKQVGAADLKEKSLLAPKLAMGLSEHVSKAYKPSTSAISLEESHTNDLMWSG